MSSISVVTRLLPVSRYCLKTVFEKWTAINRNEVIIYSAHSWLEKLWITTEMCNEKSVGTQRLAGLLYYVIFLCLNHSSQNDLK